MGGPPMKSSKRVLVLLAIVAAGAMGPAHSQPLKADAVATQSAQVYLARQTVVNSQFVSYESWYLTISNLYAAGNGTGSPSATLDFKAAASRGGCIYVPTFSCSSWNAPQQNVSVTSYQADPLGNSARIVVTVLDSTSASHTFNLTLSRPSGTYIVHSQPNFWADTTTGSAQVTLPYTSIQRGGYTVTGTADAVAVAANNNCSPSGTCMYTSANTWTSAGPAPVTING